MYEKFEQLLQNNNVTAYRVSKETGISTATLSDWKNGKSEPKNDKIQKIADYFDVPITYFYDSETPADYLVSVKGVGDFILETTIAAHKDDNENWTKNELKRIEEYKKLLLAARNSKK